MKTCLKSTRPCADQHFFAELAGIGRPAAVLGVDAAHVRAEDVDRVDRICLAVEDEVGGVEADGEVGHGHVANHARHGGRRLLAGFHQEVLPVALAVLGDGANGFDGAGIESVGGIFGNEAAVGLDLGYAEQLGEVGDLAQSVDASGAGCRRHEADGGRAAAVKFHSSGWRADDFDRGGDEIVFCEQVLKLCGNVWT